MADFKTILTKLSSALDKSHIQAPLFGGFVLPVYGVERLTMDLDFMLAEEDLDGFGVILEDLGYQRVFKNLHYAKFRHRDDGVLDIDTVFTQADSIRKIASAAAWHEVLGVSFLCVSLDMLLGTKLHAIRYNEARRGSRDFDDVVELMRVNEIELDGQRFEAICTKYGTPEIYQRLREALQHDGI